MGNVKEPRVRIYNGSVIITEHSNSTYKVYADTWYHIAWVINRGGNSTLYFNGTKVSEADISSSENQIWPKTANLILGTINVGYDYFNGTIDEFAIYNRTLNSTEIFNLYLKGADIDLIYPTFSSFWDNNGTLEDSGIGLFNVTVENTNGTVLLEIDGANYTATNLTFNVYNVSVNLTAGGTYSYRWHAWGNGTTNRYNASSVRRYTVNHTLRLGNIAYGDASTATNDESVGNISWTNPEQAVNGDDSYATVNLTNNESQYLVSVSYTHLTLPTN